MHRPYDADTEFILPEMTAEEHLQELRRRLIVSLGSVALGSGGAWIFVPDMLRRFARDVGHSFVFVSPAEGFTTYLKLAFTAGLFLASPVLVFQAWHFVLPALFPHERRLARRFVPPALALFVFGVVFAYFAVYPLALRFLLGFGGAGVEPVLSVARFVSFFVSVTVPFGLVFQFPVVLLVLVHLEIVTVGRLRAMRKPVWFLAFVVGALLTPPDVASQVLMAVPVIALFETTLWRLGKDDDAKADGPKAGGSPGDDGGKGDGER